MRCLALQLAEWTEHGGVICDCEFPLLLLLFLQDHETRGENEKTACWRQMSETACARVEEEEREKMKSRSKAQISSRERDELQHLYCVTPG